MPTWLHGCVPACIHQQSTHTPGRCAKGNLPPQRHNSEAGVAGEAGVAAQLVVARCLTGVTPAEAIGSSRIVRQIKLWRVRKVLQGATAERPSSMDNSPRQQCCCSNAGACVRRHRRRQQRRPRHRRPPS